MLLRRLVLALSTICLAAAFLMAFATGGCKTGGTPHAVSVVVSGVVDCTEGAVKDTALHILDDAASALAMGNWQAGLMDLVTRFSADAVACALSKLQGDGTRAFAIQGDELEHLKATRAQEWLDANRVVFATHLDAGAR